MQNILFSVHFINAVAEKPKLSVSVVFSLIYSLLCPVFIPADGQQSCFFFLESSYDSNVPIKRNSQWTGNNNQCKWKKKQLHWMLDMCWTISVGWETRNEEEKLWWIIVWLNWRAAFDNRKKDPDAIAPIILLFIINNVSSSIVHQ